MSTNLWEIPTASAATDNIICSDRSTITGTGYAKIAEIIGASTIPIVFNSATKFSATARDTTGEGLDIYVDGLEVVLFAYNNVSPSYKAIVADAQYYEFRLQGSSGASINSAGEMNLYGNLRLPEGDTLFMYGGGIDSAGDVGADNLTLEADLELKQDMYIWRRDDYGGGVYTYWHTYSQTHSMSGESLHYSIDGTGNDYLYVYSDYGDIESVKLKAESITFEATFGTLSIISDLSMNLNDINDVGSIFAAGAEFTGPVILKTGSNLQIRDAGDAMIFGDPSVDGAWREIRSGNDLIFQRRESGSWVTKSTIAA